MNIIVAVDSNWAIGNKGKLLAKIPEDHKFFKEMTTNKVIILGRKTLDTFPNKKPLKNRTNIILSHNETYHVDDAFVIHSVEDLLKEMKQFDSDKVFVIGGSSIYKQLLPYCDTIYVTKIKKNYEADAYFPNLDNLDNFILEKAWGQQEHNGISFCFCKYVQKK